MKWERYLMQCKPSQRELAWEIIKELEKYFGESKYDEKPCRITADFDEDHALCITVLNSQWRIFCTVEELTSDSYMGFIGTGKCGKLETRLGLDNYKDIIRELVNEALECTKK